MPRLLLISLVFSPAARACSVCAGDPSSPLNQSAAVGMLFLLAVIVTLIATSAHALRRWVRRSERMP